MTASFEQFLTNDPLNTYEDLDKYEKEWKPKVENYRRLLEGGIVPEYKIKLPGSIESLASQGFNPLKYLHQAKLLSDKEFEITDSTGSALVSKIALGQLSSVDVFNAFAKRAVIAHQFTNCALELFTEEGLERAKYLDDYFKKNGKTIGPLHGLPVSLKEQMSYKGKVTHGSYVSKITNVTEEHSVTTQVLEKLGAVFYVRTNQPQTLMHLDSNNNFIGLSRNPYNLGLSSGGSSSGEGSIVGFGGSPLGVGTDIGGSIRAPAAYSGCHGLRPTTRRLSTRGGVSSNLGQESVPSVSGPMSRSIDDIDLYMKTYINQGKPWELDAWCIPLPWKEVLKPEPKDLTIAVMYDDGLVKVSPPIQRAMKQVILKLANAGAKIVEFKPIRTVEAYETINKLYNCDGNSMQRKLLGDSGEPLAKLTKWCLNYGDGDKVYSVPENRKLNDIRDSLRQEYTTYLVENKIDFILCPTYNNVAPQPECVYNWSYTSLFNLLDFPTLAFQTGMFQDPKLDTWDPDHQNYKYRSDLEKLECNNYDPEIFKGAPIGLQLAGKRYSDESVVAAGKTIIEILDVDLYNVEL